MRHLMVEFAWTAKVILDRELFISQKCDSDPAPLF
jgi:hypothetical protein